MAHTYNLETGAWIQDPTDGWVSSKVVKKDIVDNKVTLVFEITSGAREGEVRYYQLDGPREKGPALGAGHRGGSKLTLACADHVDDIQDHDARDARGQQGGFKPPAIDEPADPRGLGRSDELVASQRACW